MLHSHVVAEPSESELDELIACWEAANYLTIAQIYLQDNPLLRDLYVANPDNFRLFCPDAVGDQGAGRGGVVPR